MRVEASIYLMVLLLFFPLQARAWGWAELRDFCAHFLRSEPPGNPIRDELLKRAESRQWVALPFLQRASDREVLMYFELLPEDLKTAIQSAPLEWIKGDVWGVLSNFSGLLERSPELAKNSENLGAFLEKIRIRTRGVPSNEEMIWSEAFKKRVYLGKVDFLLQKSHVLLQLKAGLLHLGTPGAPRSLTLRAHRIHDSEVVFKIKAGSLLHPYENPVSIEHVARLAQAGVRPLKRFEVALGMDGRFYVEDGNHRLEMLNPSEEVEAVLAQPLRTVSVPAHLVLVGAKPPESAAILQALKDKKSIRSLFDKKTQSEILFWDEIERHLMTIDLEGL